MIFAYKAFKLAYAPLKAWRALPEAERSALNGDAKRVMALTWEAGRQVTVPRQLAGLLDRPVEPTPGGPARELKVITDELKQAADILSHRMASQVLAAVTAESRMVRHGSKLLGKAARRRADRKSEPPALGQ